MRVSRSRRTAVAAAAAAAEMVETASEGGGLGSGGAGEEVPLRERAARGGGARMEREGPGVVVVRPGREGEVVDEERRGRRLGLGSF